MDGLTESYVLKERVLKCAPVLFGRFLVDLRRGTWIIGHLILIRIHKSATAKAPLIINGVPSLQRGPWSHIRHTSFPDMFLDLPCDVICSLARFRLLSHTLQIETVTWTHNTSPACYLCNADDAPDEQHVLFHCAHPHMVSLRRTYASLSHPIHFHNMSTLLSQNNNTLYFFLHALVAFYEQASIRTF